MLADGAGGRSGGAEAAEFVIHQTKQTLHSADLSPNGLSEFLKSIDRQMVAEGNIGETTCVLAVLSKTSIIGASIGDSGAWCISPSGVDDLTSRQCHKPFLGTGEANLIGFARDAWNGTLLIASDGLLKYTGSERITAAAQVADMESAAHNLIGLVRYASGALPDDVSVLLARIR
jgi:serine/threonine protein phosphatase PrpC